MAIGTIRKLLYSIAKLLGDVNAVKKGAVGKRVVSRITGKAAGKVLGKINRK